MLQHFSVKGFRCFEDKLSFDLAANRDLAFRTDAIADGVVKTGVVLADSGSGKTMLGLALLDVSRYLTKNQMLDAPIFGTPSELIEFTYLFKFGDQALSYEYGRTAYGELVYERIVIDGESYAEIDRRISGIASIMAAGAESQNRDFSGSSLSIASYIDRNEPLDKTPANECFMKFVSFVEGMLYFSASDVDSYMGFTKSDKDVGAAIVQYGLLDELLEFLQTCGLNYSLTEQSVGHHAFIGQSVGNQTLNFMDIASPGVRKLVTFFFWMKRTMATGRWHASFIYIDDMDGLHHLASVASFERAFKSSAQALLATSSTSVLTHPDARPDCCFVLGSGQISSFASRTKKELRQAHNLEKLHRGGAFD
ncbi:hypothetical protein RYA05_04410 [Pseudomonas syringae pv. actinidiae]|nr:hypothetical protein [Pseudomonas syringae pv. actinidiae]